MALLFTNNATTVLASGISSSATSLSVVSGKGNLFPTYGSGDYSYITLVDANTPTQIEVVKVTARSGDTFTIVRGQDGTTAAAFVTGSTVELRITRSDLVEMGRGQIYSQGSTGSVNRTYENLRSAEVLSVLDFGADSTGATSSLTAFTNAYNAASAGQTILIPPGSYASVSAALAGTKWVIWQAQGKPSAGGFWVLPGLVQQGQDDGNTRLSFVRGLTTADDAGGGIRVVRVTNHTGGTSGYVNSPLFSQVVTNTNNTNFEWACVGSVFNYATAGENVGVYGQGWQYAAGPTWGGTFEARDMRNTSDPTTGLVGAEIDAFANGTDTNNARVCLDIVTGKGVAGGTRCETGYGIRIGPVNNDTAQGYYKNGIALTGEMTTGISLASTTTTGFGILFSGTKATGIDLSGGTHTNAAIRIKSGEKLSFTATDSAYFRYENGFAGVATYGGGFNNHIFYDNGNLYLRGKISTSSSGNVTSTATAGTSGATPSQVANYLSILIDGTTYKVPYYNA